MYNFTSFYLYLVAYVYIFHRFSQGCFNYVGNMCVTWCIMYVIFISKISIYAQNQQKKWKSEHIKEKKLRSKLIDQNGHGFEPTTFEF